METADFIVDARWVIPVEPESTVLAEHSVAVRGGRIVAVLPTAQAAARFSPEKRYALENHALIPGLVNLHTHAAMTLLRGRSEDDPFSKWLEGPATPENVKILPPELAYDGTLLACAEMLRGGITCFNDMYFHPEAAARAALACGMRAAIGIIAIDLPTRYASDPDDYLAKGLAARDMLKDEALVSFCMAPHAAYAVGDRTFERIFTLADELDLPVHLHLHETTEEIAGSLSRHHARPIKRLQSLGLLGSRLIAVHAVQLEDYELDALASFGCSVAHCPSSNLMLARGSAPLAAMLERGINVGLGTDDAARNSRLDLFQEMRLAALLARARRGGPESMPAEAQLRAATIGGAKALGIESLTGSITPGKEADLCAVSFDEPSMGPCYDPVSHLVFAASRENVSHVWVAGRIIVDSGQLVGMDRRDLDNRIRLWQYKLASETRA